MNSCSVHYTRNNHLIPYDLQKLNAVIKVKQLYHMQLNIRLYKSTQFLYFPSVFAYCYQIIPPSKALHPSKTPLWASSCYDTISNLSKLASSPYLSVFCFIAARWRRASSPQAPRRTWWAARGLRHPTSPWGGWCTCTTAPSCTHGQSSHNAAPQSCPAWCCLWREEWPFSDFPEFAKAPAQPWVVKRSKAQE